MRRRSFLLAAGTAAISPVWRGAAQTSLGTLAWAESGSLWARQLPDGRPLKLASAEGLQRPRFSASGRWIAYRARKDKLFVVRGDGRGGAAIDGENCVWFPREDRLAVLRGDRAFAVSPETGWKSEPVLPPGSGLPVFAPDGERFVFREDFGGAGQLCLATLSTPPRKPEVLVTNTAGSVSPYGWTRDGKSILYWSAAEWSASLWNDGVDLYSVSVSHGQTRNLNLETLVHQEFLDLAPPAAGNRLAATRGRGRETWAESRIALLDLDTGSARDLTAEDIAAQTPVWSPDGRRIAYVAAPDAEAAHVNRMTGVNIRIMRPDGTVETKKVTSDMRIGIGGEEAHVFLQQRRVWLIDPAGASTPRQLTGDARYRDEAPLWSRDGEHILFGRMDYEGHPSLWLIEGSGATPSQLCKLQIFDEFGRQDDWFGFYGYIDWRSAFDWRR